MLPGAILLIATMSTQPPEQDVRAFLHTHMRFSRSDLAAVDRGKAVVKRLKQRGDRESALFGVVRIAASPQSFVEQFRNVGDFLQDKYLAQIGVLGSSPELPDLESLTVRRSDLRALRACRPTACDVNLDAGSIERLLLLDWNTPDVEERATRLFRGQLVEQARTYLAHGDSALSVYYHKPEPLSVSDGTQALLLSIPNLFGFAPELREHLKQFPDGSRATVGDLFYWTVQVFGRRPVTSLMHAAIHEPHDEHPVSVIALKQLYASHYVHAALKLMALVSETRAEGQAGMLLLYLDRTLYDFDIGGLKRIILEAILSEYLESHIEMMRDRVENGAFARISGR